MAGGWGLPAVGGLCSQGPLPRLSLTWKGQPPRVWGSRGPRTRQEVAASVEVTSLSSQGFGVADLRLCHLSLILPACPALRWVRGRSRLGFLPPQQHPGVSGVHGYLCGPRALHSPALCRAAVGPPGQGTYRFSHIMTPGGSSIEGDLPRLDLCRGPCMSGA